MRLITPNLANAEIEANEPNLTPDVDKNFGQTLARLLGFDKFNNIFRFLQSDYFGSLRVTLAQPGIDRANKKQVTMPGTFITLLPANDSRVSFIIQNLNCPSVTVFYAPDFTNPGGWDLGMGDILTEDRYTGLVAVTSTSAGIINAFELAQFRG